MLLVLLSLQIPVSERRLETYTHTHTKEPEIFFFSGHRQGDGYAEDLTQQTRRQIRLGDGETYRHADSREGEQTGDPFDRQTAKKAETQIEARERGRERGEGGKKEDVASIWWLIN